MLNEKARGLSHFRTQTWLTGGHSVSKGPAKESSLVPVSKMPCCSCSWLFIAYTYLELLLTADEFKYTLGLEGREQIRLGKGKEKTAGQLIMRQKSPEASLEEHISVGGHSRHGFEHKKWQVPAERGREHHTERLHSLGGKSTGFGVIEMSVQIPAPPFTSHTILGKSISLLKLQFPHL